MSRRKKNIYLGQSGSADQIFSVDHCRVYFNSGNLNNQNFSFQKDLLVLAGAYKICYLVVVDHLQLEGQITCSITEISLFAMPFTPSVSPLPPPLFSLYPF